MKSPLTECPRCESLQPFRPTMRPLRTDSELVQLYIRCKICNWSEDLRITTVEIERLRLYRSELLDSIERAKGNSNDYSNLTQMVNKVDNVLNSSITAMQV